MSYEEKGQWVYLVAIVLSLGAYVAIVLGQPAEARWLTSTTSR